MYRGTPRFSDSGVNSTTTSSGTIKIRESVSALGRFTRELQLPIVRNNTQSYEDIPASRVYGSLFCVSRQPLVLVQLTQCIISQCNAQCRRRRSLAAFRWLARKIPSPAVLRLGSDTNESKRP